MNRVRIFVAIWSLLLVGLAATPSYAMRFWKFRIERNGERTFIGGYGMHDQTPPIDVLRAGIHKAKFRLDRDSVITAEEAEGGVTLEGDLVFSCPDLADFHMKRARLIRLPNPNPANTKYQWQLHADDADSILNYYESLQPAAPAPVNNPTAVAATRTKVWPIAAIGCGLLVVLATATVFLIRGLDQDSSKSGK